MTEQQDWLSENQRYLMAALHHVRMALQAHADTEANIAAHEMPAHAVPSDRIFPLDLLCRIFNLSSYERDLLLLCAGIELDATFAALCAAAQGDPGRSYPTFSVALAALPDAHWSAITPTAPLRHWRLLDVGAGNSLMHSPLRIDERILHYLTGVPGLDEQLLGFVTPLSVTTELVASQRRLADQITALWSQNEAPMRLPAVQLVGHEALARQAVAAAVCADLGLVLYQMQAQVVPTTPHELDILLRLWEREAALSGAALVLDCDMADGADALRQSTLTHFIDRVGTPLFVTAHERRQDQRRPLLTYEVHKPTTQEQQTVWEKILGSAAVHLNGQVERLTSQFNLGVPTIQAVSLQAMGGASAGDTSADLPSLLWQACRRQARPHLDDRAQRIEPVATWDDLILPKRQAQTLHEIAVHVRQRTKVYEEWGFAAKSARGLGISAMFAGPSGTGKTMAAEVLANELQLDLYRIDLSQVVSKYIGETEKNLRRVFDAAEEGGAILLFDEADALFGKRSEVKDSHDRYANIEVSYLLQRMEVYRGLAILTTNMKKALDTAFLRRIRFIVRFPFPDMAMRMAIWQQIYPVGTPTAGLDLQKLARLNVAGGNIRNIALNAAFLAAEADQPVQMAHLLQAARTEYGKLEQSLTDGETKGWV